jgi:ubiquinone/menaquinone biosynthesis C-methylase UbiE
MLRNDWEKVYSASIFRNKNQYPSEEIISFMMQNYGELKNKSSIKVLDMGCGWGNNLKFLKDQGFSGTGIDTSKTAIQNCISLGYDAQVCDFGKLTFRNNSFDVVIDRQSIQHNTIKNIKKTIQEVERVLKKDGSFYSVMVSEADYDFYTTYMTESGIREILSDFNIISIDKYIKTSNNQSAKATTLLIHAKKPF